MANPILRVVKDDGKFCIRDEKDAQYGRYDTKEEAKESAVLWQEYYSGEILEQD